MLSPGKVLLCVVGLGTGGALLGLVYRRRTRTAARRRLATELRPGLRSMLLGIALGDAFGAGIEFQDAEWIRDAKNVDFRRWVNVRGPYFTLSPTNSRNFSGGMYTDDTEMTAGLMKALLESKAPLTQDTLMEYWRKEYDLAKTHFISTWLWGLVGVGRNGHGSIAKVYAGQATLAAVQRLQADRPYPGNAPPMRALPLAFVPPGRRLPMCILNADTTHPHPKARLASYLMATAGAFLLREGGAYEDVLSHCIAAGDALETHSPEAYDAETLAYLRSVDALPDWHGYGPCLQGLPLEALCGPQPIPWATQMRGSPVRGLDSSAMHTVGVVLYLLKWHQGPLDALRAAMWVGGDVDSVGALVLGLVGGRGGLGFGSEWGLPLWMVDRLEDMEGLVRLADAFGVWTWTQWDD